MQDHFVRKKQTVHSGVLNSDTLVDASVTVCAIYIDQCSSNFLGEDISYLVPHKLSHKSSRAKHLA